MRKTLLLATMVELYMMMSAAPAMAQEFGADDVKFFCDDDDDDSNGLIECEGLFVVTPVGDFCDDFDGDFFCDDDFKRFDFNNGLGDFEQEAESGDVNQNFYVSNTGDNSNQSAAIRDVRNTGNAQNQIDITQFDGFNGNDFNNEDEFCEDLEEFCEDFNGFGSGSDFEFEDVGASIDVSPTQTFESNQQINQSAVAVGDMKYWW